MRSVGIATIWPKLCLILALVFAIMGQGPGVVLAQQPPKTDNATQQKIDQLAKLLADPDIRALLASRQSQPSTDMIAVPSASDLTLWIDSLRQHLVAVGDAVPLVPGEFERAAGTTMDGIDGRRPGAVLLLFLLLVAIGLAAEWVFGRIARHLHAGRGTVLPGTGAGGGFHAIGRHAFVEIAPLMVFGLASIGLFLMLTWPPLLVKLIVPMLLGLIAGRFVVRLAKVLLAPFANADGTRPIRFIPIDDGAARFWFVRTVVFMLIFFVGWAASSIMTELGIIPTVREVVVYALGIGLLVLGIEIVWRRPRHADRPSRQGVTEWLLTFWLCALWILWVAGANVLMWLGLYLVIVPAAIKIVSSVVHNAFDLQRSPTQPANPFYEVLVERGVRAATIAVAVLWLAAVMRFHSTMMMQEETASRILRGVLSGVVILLLADIFWQLVKALINHRLDRARLDQGDAAEQAKSGRLLTLLPILRNFLAVLIGAIAIMMVLSGLGVEVGPLIAGAGIFGVAIGFGSQTLVKDVISGIFYMMDDAFRVGEYIQSGNYKGTVESFSIRSVKLRHHRGPIFTVPFGVLGAVQNMSRDWVIDKFLISVSYQTDIALVKKLVKGVGTELLEDPELGPMIIETVKMKGVEQFGDYGINLSFAMMTKPGHQSGVRRRAFALIREAFIANGIEFASPTVQVANEEHAAAAAALAVNNSIALKKAADVAAEG